MKQTRIEKLESDIAELHAAAPEIAFSNPDKYDKLCERYDALRRTLRDALEYDRPQDRGNFIRRAYAEMPVMTDDERRAAAARMGSHHSPKPRNPALLLPCTCNQEPHKRSCPVWRRERRRMERERAKRRE